MYLHGSHGGIVGPTVYALVMTFMVMFVTSASGVISFSQEVGDSFQTSELCYISFVEAL